VLYFLRMAQDDWRVRVELEEERHATDFLARLGLDLGSEARELAKELEERRLAVSNDADSVFVYAPTRDAARKAKAIVESELAELGLDAEEVRIEHWLHDEERWDDEPPSPDTEEELLAEGYAPWEVRIELDSADEARELAEKLEQEGYGVVRRHRYVIAGTATKEDAEALASRVHGKVEPGGELVYEVTPQNPFAIFGGLGT
jgi:hypothetical protein